MTKACVIGLGDMGSGLAKNLLAAGFEVSGFDLKKERMEDFAAMGGTVAPSPDKAAQGCEAAFVMVMNGGQAKDVIFGADGNGGLQSSLVEGSTIILTATIKPKEAREIGAMLDGSG
ncbi:MAG: NAD(P)-binding domain-containing protein, partial [Rhizobiaceae bacterium]